MIGCLIGIIVFPIIGVSIWLANMSPDEREAYQASISVTRAVVTESAQPSAPNPTVTQVQVTEQPTNTPILQTAAPTPSPTESVEDYMAKCEEIEWKELARYPDNYIGKRIKVTGKVTQILSGTFLSDGGYRVYEDYEISSGDTWLQREWFMKMDVKHASPKILENDIITFYGEFGGTIKVTRSISLTTEEVITLKVLYYTIHE